MITETLSKLGLSIKEGETYQALLKLGYASASGIAHELRIPRQTAYSILDNLVEKEFIEQSNKRGVRQFFVNPNKLLLLIDKQKQKLETNRVEIEKMLPSLISQQTRRGALPRVQYYEGRDGLKNLFTNILEQYKKGESRMFKGYGVNSFKKAFGDFLYKFVEKRHEYGVKTQLMIGRGPDDFDIKDESSRYGRIIKRMNIDPQKAGIYLVGKKVYLFSYIDNVGIVIENEAISELLQQSFDDHWKKS